MNQIKLLTIAICALMWSGEVAAQSLKTHKGELNGGNETYTYFTNDDEEVRQGAYSYIRSDSNSDGATSKQTIKGQYVKGYKDGTWYYTFKQVDVENGYNNYITATTSMTMTYKDGMPNGIWKYSVIGKRRSRNYSLVGWSWGNYVATEPTHISTNFSNGVMVGNVTYKTPWGDVNGKLDDEGWHTGIWKIDKQGTIINFINGIALYEPKDKKLTELQRKIASLPDSERKAFCFENRLTMELMPSSNFFDINDGYFNNSMWLHREITGDKTYTTEDDLNYIDSKEYGKYYFVDYVKMVHYSSVISTNYMNSDEMQESLDKNMIRLSDEDIAIVQNLIAEKKSEEEAKLAAQQRNIECFNQLVAGREEMIAIYNKAKSCKLELPKTPAYEEWNIYVDNMIYNYHVVTKYIDRYDNGVTQLNLIASSYAKPSSSFEYIDHLDYAEKVTAYNTAISDFKLSIASYARLNKWVEAMASYFYDFPEKYSMIFSERQLNSLLIKRNNAIENNLIEVVNQRGAKELDIENALNNATLITEMCHRIDSLYGKFKGVKTNKKLLKEYSKIRKDITKTLNEKWDDTQLEKLDCVTQKVDSLLGTDTKTLEKSISKEKGIDGKVSIILKL